MFDKKIFKLQLLDFLEKSLILCEKNNEKLVSEEIKYPQFFENGKYKKFDFQKSTDYNFFINHIVKGEITQLQEYSILIKFFVTKEFQNYNNKLLSTGYENVETKPNYSKELPLKFLLEYVRQNRKFSINKKVYEKVFQKFFIFMENLLEDEYVTPLFNFESDIDEKGIEIDRVKIRKIKEHEFFVFSNLEENATLSNIFHNLTHVMFMKLSSPDLNSGYDEVRIKFQNVIDSLSLLKEGNPRIGGIFRNITNPWIHYDSRFENEVISKTALKLKKTDKHKLKQTYDLLVSIDFSKKENKFLEISKKRFVLALSRTSKIDQLIDLMISLESLYVSSPGEITVRLSNRLSTLIGKNDNEREDLWKFTKKVYNIRSGIVHGEGLRSNEINGKKYTLDEILTKLIELNRESILTFLKLVNFYSGKNKIDQICDDIDKALINRTFYKELKSKI